MYLSFVLYPKFYHDDKMCITSALAWAKHAQIMSSRVTCVSTSHLTLGSPEALLWVIDISGKFEQSFKAKDSRFFFFIMKTAIKGPRSFQKKKKKKLESKHESVYFRG